MREVVLLILVLYFFSILDFNKIRNQQTIYNSHINNGISEIKRTTYYKYLSNKKEDEDSKINEPITFEND